MEFPGISFERSFTTYSVSGQKIVSDCNEITFQNLDAVPLLINQQFRIAQYERITFTGNWLEIDRTQYDLTAANGGSLIMCVVVRKVYKNEHEVRALLIGNSAHK